MAKYTYDELMNMDIEQVRKIHEKVGVIKSIIAMQNEGPRRYNDYRFLSPYQVVEIVKWASLSTAVVAGCFFIGKGLGNRDKETE